MNKILMYHSIGNHDNNEVGAELYCVSVEKFREQMEFVAKLGTVPLQSLRVCPRRGLTLQIGGDSPYITFDDGLMDNYTEAYPVLEELNLKAYFFILVSKVDTAGYMNWEQIRQLMDAGMIIGSHGMTHRILTELKDKELDYELSESKKILEQKLGAGVEYLSIPRGFTNKNVIEKVKKVGYKAVFTSNPKDSDGYKRGRIPVKSNWSIEYFARVMKNGPSLKDRAGEWVKGLSKKMLGAKNYDRVRSAILKRQ